MLHQTACKGHQGFLCSALLAPGLVAAVWVGAPGAGRQVATPESSLLQGGLGYGMAATHSLLAQKE